MQEAIVPALRAFAAHLRTHPSASLSTHEQGVLDVLRAHAAPLLDGVLQASTSGLTPPQTPTRRLRAACPTCPRRLRPQSRTGRARTLLTRLGPVTLQRPWYHCRACRHGWSPADQTLGLVPHQRTSSGLQQGEAMLGARLPFAESQPVQAALTGLELGIETLRTHAEQVGTRFAAAEQAAIAQVLGTQDPLPARYAPVPDDQRLLIETDGVLVRYRGTGCLLGTGRACADPAYRPPQVCAPTDTAGEVLSERL